MRLRRRALSLNQSDMDTLKAHCAQAGVTPTRWLALTVRALPTVPKSIDEVAEKPRTVNALVKPRTLAPVEFTLHPIAETITVRGVIHDPSPRPLDTAIAGHVKQHPTVSLVCANPACLKPFIRPASRVRKGSPSYCSMPCVKACRRIGNGYVNRLPPRKPPVAPVSREPIPPRPVAATASDARPRGQAVAVATHTRPSGGGVVLF